MSLWFTMKNIKTKSDFFLNLAMRQKKLYERQNRPAHCRVALSSRTRKAHRRNLQSMGSRRLRARTEVVRLMLVSKQLVRLC